MLWCSITQGIRRIRIHLRIRISVPPAAGCVFAQINLAKLKTNSEDPLSHVFHFEKRWGVDKTRDAARSYCRSAWLRIRISIPPAAGCTAAPFNLETSLTHSNDPFSHLSYVERTDGVLTHV